MLLLLLRFYQKKVLVLQLLVDLYYNVKLPNTNSVNIAITTITIATNHIFHNIQVPLLTRYLKFLIVVA